MKNIIFTIFTLLALNSNATHWGQYFIYIEVDYVQGPWMGVEILKVQIIVIYRQLHMKTFLALLKKI